MSETRNWKRRQHQSTRLERGRQEPPKYQNKQNTHYTHNSLSHGRTDTSCTKRPSTTTSTTSPALSTRIMSKGTRFLTVAIPVVVVYLLMWLHWVPVPFLAPSTVDDIFPVVSVVSLDLPAPLIPAPMVAAGHLWLVLFDVSRPRVGALQRHARGIREFAARGHTSEERAP